MEKIENSAPPDWEEVVILWEDVFSGPMYPIRQMLEWVKDTPGDVYHLHGWNSTEGFSFRFRNPNDATHFKLKWL